MHPRILTVLDYDIDNHLNRVVPHSRISRLPKSISRFLGYRSEEYKEPPRLVVVFWSFLGSLLGLLIIGALYKYAPGIRKWHPPIMIASLVCRSTLRSQPQGLTGDLGRLCYTGL
jgi:O-antigen/teichoic acid export membrane protein